MPRRLSAGRISPPPPPRTEEDDVEESDSTATADSDLEQALRNTRRNSGSLEASPAGLTRASGTGAPYNPFARTLASSDAAFGLQRTEAIGYGADERDGHAQESKGSAGRPAMDVDQFKNILLTGSAVPSPPSGLSATANQHTARYQDSSSNTTASSSSTFEPYLDVQQDTPRTSFDQLDYPSDSSDGDDEERSGLMTGTERLDDFAPPAPPKHSHGRPYAPKGPQTVSFADFDETITEGSRAHAPAITTNGSNSLRPPALRRSTSDLNKPLPPPPQEPIALQKALPVEPDITPSTPQQDPPAPAATEETPDSKKPPPPPVSRRAGQQTTAQPQSAPTSTAPQSPTPSDSLPTTRRPSDEQSSKPANAPPPPPPSRKAKANAQSTLEPPSPTPSTATPSSTSTDPKQMPPPPPRRMVSKAGNSVNRTPSSASSHSSTQKRDPSGSGMSSSIAAPAPAPPPPRRGVGAKRESTEVAFAQQPENEAVASIAPSKGDGETRDVLADLTAFQAEIDALRARAERPG